MIFLPGVRLLIFAQSGRSNFKADHVFRGSFPVAGSFFYLQSRALINEAERSRNKRNKKSLPTGKLFLFRKSKITEQRYQ